MRAQGFGTLGWNVRGQARSRFDPSLALTDALIILALWNTTLTQLMWFGGLSAAPDIARACYLFFLKPVIAAALAVPILGSYRTPLQIIAIVLVTSWVGVELYWPRLCALIGRRG